MAQIECRNLTLGYESTVIISGLDFDVESGDYLCIVGENGSGKTTLVRAMLGLQDPIGGDIVFSEGLNRADIGYLPQKTNIRRDFPAVVNEIVLSGCQSHMDKRVFYNSSDRQLAAECMERMGISELSRKSYRELSGGQQQRVLLARALCAMKKVLILDEPVTGLDPRGTAEMYQLIYELYASGITIIMISHDVDAAIRYADHILHLGQAVFYGSKKEYLTTEAGVVFMASREKAVAVESVREDSENMEVENG